MPERLYLRLDGDATHGPESDTPDGTLRNVPVAAALQAHVAHILLYRETLRDGDEVLERVLPDGATRLVFNLAHAPSTDGAAAPAAAVLGASAAPAIVRLAGRMDGVTVTLQPGAAAALLGLPAGEMAETAVPLEALWGRDAAHLLERLAAAPGDAARARLLQTMLLRRLRAGRAAAATPAAGAAEALRLIRDSDGRRPLREVAAAVGIGERRLQQIFHAHVGLSPRASSRLARLHGLLRTLRARPTPAWAQLAGDAGFFDQSHLVNEFRALCGLTPGEFMARAVSGSSKTAA
jgi:AraC-like DNA-binding protein